MLQKCFNERKKNQVRSRTSNHCVSQKRAQIESLVIYRKNNSKKHNNISLEEILTLLVPISQNDQTHSNNSSAICRRIVWVCLTILWDWRLKG